MPDLIIGIDVGMAKISGGLMTVKGEVLQSYTVPTLANEGFETSFHQMLSVIERLVYRPGKQNVIGIGVFVPGEVDPENGVVVNLPNLPGWREVQLTQKIKEQFGLPARLAAEMPPSAESRTDIGRVHFAASLFLGEKPPSFSEKQTPPRNVTKLLAAGIITAVILSWFFLQFRAARSTALAPCDPTQASFCRVQIFFATDRKPSGQSIPAKYFSGERSDDNDPLTFGTLDVSIPARHKTGRIEEPLPFFTPDPTPDVVVIDLKVAPESRFFHPWQMLLMLPGTKKRSSSFMDIT